MPNIMKGDR